MAAMPFATRVVVSNSAIAPSACRTRIAVGAPSTRPSTPLPGSSATASHQPALRLRRGDEACEQRVGLEGAGFKLRMKLHADEPRMIDELDRFGQETVGRHAGKDKALLFQGGAVGGVDFVAVA